MKPLVLIPARGGSKGLPAKNIKILNGKPLIHYTIEAARQVFSDNEICVTTEDFEIKNIVEKTGLKVPFIRPLELATDIATTQDVILHAIKYYNQIDYFPDIIILLQPTSPFRRAQHIREAISLYDQEIDMVVSVKKTHSNPYFNLFEESKEGFLEKSKKGNFNRRQNCPIVYELNGAIYVINPKVVKSKLISRFKKVKKYVMDDESSLDIDTAFDWKIAETLIQNINS
ncbi:MAG: CMP-N-acetylneuraminic acid synthetase [Crocinitomicaceae bacterium]|nr:CMP-N-acetylneuraminic acid synthetase [Crocinitomicaceae bacterium]|tara:strand:- start:8156 stop:8842 length:687 start_codon:yes stop_codon:yes gene_type:complete